jgi:hypothetical protein
VTSLAQPERSVAIDPGRLAQIAQALTDAGFLQQHLPDARSGYVSCFHYTVSIRSPDGSSVAIETDGLGMTGELLRTVDQLVAALIEAL